MTKPSNRKPWDSIRELRRVHGTKNRNHWRQTVMGTVGNRVKKISFLRKTRLVGEFDKSSKGKSLLRKLNNADKKLSQKILTLRSAGTSSGHVIWKAQNKEPLEKLEKDYLNALIAKYNASINYSEVLMPFLSDKGAFKSTIIELKKGIESLQDIVKKLKSS